MVQTDINGFLNGRISPAIVMWYSVFEAYGDDASARLLAAGSVHLSQRDIA